MKKAHKQSTSDKRLELAVENLLEGKSLSAPPPSKGLLETLYSMGFGFYESGHYEKAEHFFRYLTVLSPKEKKHWTGLGAAYQMQKKYALAVQAYCFAALIDENDPFPHFHAAECLYRIDHKPECIEALKAAETIAKKKPAKFAQLLNKISLMINNKKKEGKKSCQ